MAPTPAAKGPKDNKAPKKKAPGEPKQPFIMYKKQKDYAVTDADKAAFEKMNLPELTGEESQKKYNAYFRLMRRAQKGRVPFFLYGKEGQAPCKYVKVEKAK